MRIIKDIVNAALVLLGGYTFNRFVGKSIEKALSHYGKFALTMRGLAGAVTTLLLAAGIRKVFRLELTEAEFLQQEVSKALKLVPTAMDDSLRKKVNDILGKDRKELGDQPGGDINKITRQTLEQIADAFHGHSEAGITDACQFCQDAARLIADWMGPINRASALVNHQPTQCSREVHGQFQKDKDDLHYLELLISPDKLQYLIKLGHQRIHSKKRNAARQPEGQPVRNPAKPNNSLIERLMNVTQQDAPMTLGATIVTLSYFKTTALYPYFEMGASAIRRNIAKLRSH